MQQPHATGERVLALLPAGTQHAGQNLVRARSIPGPVPAPHLAGDHHAANGSFRRIVGGVQPRTVQEREQPQPFMFEMPRQPAVRWVPPACFQHPVQFGFQLSGGDREAVLGDFALLMAVAQLQARFQQILYGSREGQRRLTSPARVPSPGSLWYVDDVVRWQGTDENAERGERESVSFGSKFTVRFTVHFAIRPHGWNRFARRYGLAARTAKSLQDS